MAQSGFGGLTHWGLKPSINYTSPPPRRQHCTLMQVRLGSLGGVDGCEECAGGRVGNRWEI